VSGQLHAPLSFTLLKEPVGTHWMKDRNGSGQIWTLWRRERYFVLSGKLSLINKYATVELVLS
jgi:hypothetical protein